MCNLKHAPQISMMLGVGLLVSGQLASAQLAPGSLDVKWSGGAEDCEAGPAQAPIQVHQYNAETFILRERLCATFEAPFIYLLLGSSKALLIDTGADEHQPKIDENYRGNIGRLRLLKRQYDPPNLFRLNANILPA